MMTYDGHVTKLIQLIPSARCKSHSDRDIEGWAKAIGYSARNSSQSHPSHAAVAGEAVNACSQTLIRKGGLCSSMLPTVRSIVKIMPPLRLENSLPYFTCVNEMDSPLGRRCGGSIFLLASLRAL